MVVLNEKISKCEIDSIYLPNDLSRLLRDIAEFKKLQKLLLETNVQLFDLNGNQ